jgi:hypothetical protein
VNALVSLVRDDAARVRAALDDAAARNDPALVDWSVMLTLALQAVTGGEAGGFAASGRGGGASRSKARGAGPTADLWQQLQFLFEQSERSGRHLTVPLIESCMAEVRAMLHGDAAAAAGSGAAASSSAAAADPVKIQAAIPALAAIMQIIFSYPPYAQCVKQEHMHGQSPRGMGRANRLRAQVRAFSCSSDPRCLCCRRF